MKNKTPALPLISVVIPCFNSKSTLHKSVDSVLAQTCKVYEIILVDDASNDGTAALILSLERENPLIKAITLRKNSGAAAARNAGILQATGKYVAFLDSDDTWHPGKLAKQIRQFEKNPQCTIVSCDSIFVNEEGRLLKRSHITRPPVQGRNAWKTLLAYNFLPTPTVLVKREDILQCGMFNDSLVVGEDLDLWVRIAHLGEVEVIHEVLVTILDRPQSLMKENLLERLDTYVMPMIEGYVKAWDAELTAADKKNIIGQRNFDHACICYYNGDVKRSVAKFKEALRQGYRPIKSLSHLSRLVLRSLVSKRS